jgi:predicted nucleic acid-binding protein
VVTSGSIAVDAMRAGDPGTISWMDVRPTPPAEDLTSRFPGLDPGEVGVLALAVSQTDDATLLLDDREAREAASILGFEHPGVLGILLAAKEPGIVPAVRPFVERLQRRYFSIAGERHTLVAVKHMTEEIGRQEIGTLKKVIRIVSHEINNSLGPIRSLVSSGRIAVKRPEHDGGTRFTVMDRGAGLSDEVLHSALLPFFTTKPNGTGLGLALSREIVESHRGRLRLARREEGGAAVSFWLPDRETPSAALSNTRARLTLTSV